MISTYVGENKEFERQFLSGETRSRAGAAGHVRRADSRRRRRHRRILHADRLRHDRRRGQGDADDRRQAATCSRRRSAPTSRSCKACKGDRAGNLVYRRTARNFNPVMATAGKVDDRRSRAARRAWARSIRTTSSRPASSSSTSSRAPATRSGSRSGRCAHDARHPRADRHARRPRAAGRRLRQPRHRHADARRQLHSAGHRHHAAFRERHARRRSVSRGETRSIPI